MLAPGATPREIVARVHASLKALAQKWSIQERFSSRGLELELSAPADFSAYLRSEVAKWASVVRGASIRME